MDMIRFFDILFASLGLIILSPFFIIIAICIKFTSAGSVFFKQTRVGKNNIDFKLFKFRSMMQNAELKGQLTIGGKDNRITTVGYYLRKFKLDELPQFLNVLFGDMSIVGPRPEVRKYVDLYNEHQKKILLVLPGITDYASVAFRNENELLAKAANPELFYIQEVMPKKIELNFKFIKSRNIKTYFFILFSTVITTFRGK